MSHLCIVAPVHRGCRYRYGWATFFTVADALAGACCGRDVASVPWALTAEGAALALLQSAFVGSGAMAPLLLDGGGTVWGRAPSR